MCFRSLAFVSRRLFFVFAWFCVVVGFYQKASWVFIRLTVANNLAVDRIIAYAQSVPTKSYVYYVFEVETGEQEEIFAPFSAYYRYAFAFGRFVFEHFPFAIFLCCGQTNMHHAMRLCNYILCCCCKNKAPPGSASCLLCGRRMNQNQEKKIEHTADDDCSLENRESLERVSSGKQQQLVALSIRREALTSFSFQFYPFSGFITLIYSIQKVNSILSGGLGKHETNLETFPESKKSIIQPLPSHSPSPRSFPRYFCGILTSVWCVIFDGMRKSTLTRFRTTASRKSSQNLSPKAMTISSRRLLCAANFHYRVAMGSIIFRSGRVWS